MCHTPAICAADFCWALDTRWMRPRSTVGYRLVIWIAAIVVLTLTQASLECYTESAIKKNISWKLRTIHASLDISSWLVSLLISIDAQEVVDIMITLFDQEKVWEIERYNIRKEGREEGIRQLIQRMLAKASIGEISRITGYSEEEINRILKT